MPTGTTSDFQITRSKLIELSFSMIGVSEPSTQDTALALNVLNSLVRHLDVKGTWLWAMDSQESTLTTIGGQASYTTPVDVLSPLATEIAGDMLRLEYAAVQENATTRRVLRLLDKQTTFDTVLKDDVSSEPIAIYLQRAALRSNNKIFIYPTPNSAYTVKYNYRRPLFDFDKASDNPDFPQDFFLPLQKLLAAELSPHFNKPLQERQLLQLEGERAFQESVRFNSDKPTYQTLKTEYF